jgi:hypothetical protein
MPGLYGSASSEPVLSCPPLLKTGHATADPGPGTLCPCQLSSRPSQRTRFGSPKFFVLCWILLRRTPFKYAAAGLVALEWQGQRRLLGILVEHWDVITGRNHPRAVPKSQRAAAPCSDTSFPGDTSAVYGSFSGFVQTDSLIASLLENLS